MPSFPPLTAAAAMTVLMVLASPTAFASGGPPMITDDPGTPGDGHWEINVAELSSHAGGNSVYQLPLIDANYGVGDRLQLKLQMPWLVQTGDDPVTGSGNPLAGVKWRFYDAGDNGWQASTYPQVELAPPGSDAIHNGLADSGTSYLLPLEFVHGFAGYDINVDIGRWLRHNGEADSWIAGAVFTREISKGVEALAELHEESDVHSSRSELIANLGARYDFSERYTLLLSVGRDLHNTLAASNTLLTYAGLQVRF